MCTLICLSVCPCVCQSVRLSACPSVCQFVRLFVCLSICPSLSVHPSVCQSVRLPACPSVRLFACRSVCLEVSSTNLYIKVLEGACHGRCRPAAISELNAAGCATEAPLQECTMDGAVPPGSDFCTKRRWYILKWPFTDLEILNLES